MKSWTNLRLFRFIFSFIKQQPIYFSLILIAASGWALDAAIWPFIIKKILSIFTEYDQNRASAFPLLWGPIIFGLSFWILIEIFYRAMGFFLSLVIPRMEASIRMVMFEHIQKHSPRYFNDRFSGSLANKIGDCTTQISTIVQQCITTFFPALLAFFLATGFLLPVSLPISLMVSIWIIYHVGVCIIFSRRIDEIEHLHSEARSSLVGKIVDSLTNNFAVNLFYRFAFENRYIHRSQQIEMALNQKAKQTIEIMRIWLGAGSLIGPGIAINGSIIYLWLNGSLTTGETVQVFNTMWNIMTIAWISGSSIPGLFQSIGICKQGTALLSDPQDIHDVDGAEPLVISQGMIRFDNVSFSYGSDPLFQGKQLIIPGGQKVGLVGYSGAGKTTFVNLILRLYTPTNGSIFIDNQDISLVTLESLRNVIALIPQEPILFHRTLLENIRYGRIEASDEEVLEAAKKAHCHEFISKLSKGYETLVGERGTKLSGGERQRIAIARAFLSKAPILILDEATSALDSATEKLIQESIEDLMKGKTTIIIAHRLSTIAKMDRILVFEKGKIVEDGSHEALLRSSGNYAKLWSIQSIQMI